MAMIDEMQRRGTDPAGLAQAIADAATVVGEA
jgi:hypothetical protein